MFRRTEYFGDVGIANYAHEVPSDIDDTIPDDLLSLILITLRVVTRRLKTMVLKSATFY